MKTTKCFNCIGIGAVLIITQLATAAPYPDINADGIVNVTDLSLLSQQWHHSDCGDINGWCNQADIAHSGTVDLDDISIMAQHWLEITIIPTDGILIAGAVFQMGDCLNEGESDEFPVHTVSLSPFCISKYEITNIQYCQFLNQLLQAQAIYREASGSYYNGIVRNLANCVYCKYCPTEPPIDPSKINRSHITFRTNAFVPLSISGRDLSNDPVEYVTWYGAAAYCNWRSIQDGREQCYDTTTWVCDYSKSGYRLPTEAEWEYAARANLTASRFPCGNTITHEQANYFSSDLYWYDQSSTRGYHPTWINSKSFTPYTSVAGYFPAEGFGLYDMTGNVQEWCNDGYAADFYTHSPISNPVGFSLEDIAVIRGGSCSSSAYECRSSNRSNMTRSYSSSLVGFRIITGSAQILSGGN